MTHEAASSPAAPDRPACRLVILDFDGTLADTFPWFSSVLNSVALRYGFRAVAPDEVDLLRGCGAREVLARLGIPSWKVPFIARHMRRRAAEARDDFPLFPGMDEAVRAMHAAGVELAVVTSNREATVRHVLGPELAARIAFYRCGTSLFGKATVFRRLLRESGVSPAMALAVGDESRDFAAARRAGIAFAAVPWGYMHPDALRAHGVERVFASAQDLCAAVLGPGGG